MEKIKRTFIENCDQEKKDLIFFGWVYEIRELSNIKFILLRDSSGIIQCTLKKSSKIWEKFNKVSLESLIKIQGNLKKAIVKSSETTIKNFEIEIIDFELLNKSEKLPINIIEKEINTSLSKRLDYRFIDMKKPQVKAIFKIQNTIANSFREFFYNKGFIEIQPPIIIGSSSEGGTELFKLNYFEKKAYLAQSPQLYKQLCAINWEKVFSISPVFRAEKHNTLRHLNESRQMDIELAFADSKKAMEQIENVLKYIVKKINEKNSQEIELLNVKLKEIKAKYFTFSEIIELMKKEKIKIEKYDLSSEAEKKLGELYPNTIIFVYDWPLPGKPFYIMPKNENEKSKLSEGFDAIYNGIEISSGGQRIHLPKLLIQRLKANKLNPKNFKDYINGFKYGAPIHSGWSIGLERLTMALLNLKNIRECCLFPRDRERIIP